MPCKAFMSMVNNEAFARFHLDFLGNKMTPETAGHLWSHFFGLQELLEVLEDEVYVIGGIVDRSVGGAWGLASALGWCEWWLRVGVKICEFLGGKSDI